MSGRNPKRDFVARPGTPDAWVRTPEPKTSPERKGETFTARLTVDVTPELRGRIKVMAFQRGLTVADMLRDLLVREFSNENGGTA